jgi:ribosomal-protein-alanine N-acetyltransferase
LQAFYIAALTEGDIDAILAIEKQSFNLVWKRSSFLEELADTNAYGYIVKGKGCNNVEQVVAYVCFRLITNELHILKIAVTPECRCRGLASWLLTHCISMACNKGAEAALLEVRISNKPALSFYHKLGFHLIGKRANYYSDTREDALVLIKKLKEAT